MNDHRALRNPRPPTLLELGPNLLQISIPRRIFTLSLPFLYVALYFLFATRGWWIPALLAVVCLSFITYGSISHDLVHRTLGLRSRTNDLFLSVIELLTLRSGHAYRLAHLHHHARFPHADDIEGAAARMSLPRTVFEGMIFQFKIWLWSLKQAKPEAVGIIRLEGGGCLLLVILSVILYPLTPSFLIYVALTVMGSWIIPLVTSHIPHDPSGDSVLYQTRLFRGRIASLIAVEHLYHLEHHLYPAVPHHNWPELAKRLDPFFKEAGVKAIRIWF